MSEHQWDEERRRFVADDDGPGGRDGDGGPLGLLATEFVGLAGLLAEERTVRGVLQRIVDVAKAVVPGSDLASITVRDDRGRYHTPVETDGLATRLDEWQYRLGEGPCVEATRIPGPAVTYSRDLAAGREYPAFGREAAALGVRCVLAVGLFPGGELPRLGALNLYSVEVGGLDEQDRDVALVLAAHASTALAATLATSAADLEVAQLKEALRSRDVIGQAKGILMERRGISADEAFETLRRASQALNVKLTTIAQTVVDRRAEL